MNDAMKGAALAQDLLHHLTVLLVHGENVIVPDVELFPGGALVIGEHDGVLVRAVREAQGVSKLVDLENKKNSSINCSWFS